MKKLLLTVLTFLLTAGLFTDCQKSNLALILSFLDTNEIVNVALLNRKILGKVTSSGMALKLNGMEYPHFLLFGNSVLNWHNPTESKVYFIPKFYTDEIVRQLFLER